jgi:hypothetical protein
MKVFRVACVVLLLALRSDNFALVANDGVSATDYGVVADGIADDTPSLQKALQAAATKGGVCFLPAGNYRIDGSLIVPPGVTLKGCYEGVPHPLHPTGTVLNCYGGRGDADGEPAIVLEFNASIRNVLIHYPEQSLPPEVAPYPWTIQIRGEMCQVVEVAMTNPYRAIDAGTHPNELHLIRDVYACPLNIGVYVDRCTDVGRLENIHFNPNLWKRSNLHPKLPAHPPEFSGGQDAYLNSILQPYLRENLIGFKIGRTDWEYITNCFVIFAKQGFLFDDFGHGPGNALVTQSGSDLGDVAVQINKTQRHAGVQFNNCQFMSTVKIGGENVGPVKISNCGFWVVKETLEQVVNEGAGTVILNACHFHGWDIPEKGVACIRATNGRMVVSHCDFSRSITSLMVAPQKPAVLLEAGLVSCSIVGCLFRSDTIANTSSGQLEMSANVFEPAPTAAELAQRTLKSICEDVGVPFDRVAQILKENGIQVDATTTLESLSQQSRMSPGELFRLIASYF